MFGTRVATLRLAPSSDRLKSVSILSLDLHFVFVA